MRHLYYTRRVIRNHKLGMGAQLPWHCCNLATVVRAEALSLQHLPIMFSMRLAQSDMSDVLFVAEPGEHQMIRPDLTIRNAVITGLCAALALGIANAPRARAEDAAPPPSLAYVDDLKACRAIVDADERLACYDAKVGAIVSASDAGDVRIIDRDDLVRTQRQLFGFTVPDLDILKGNEQDKEANEVLLTSITAARQLSGQSWRFTTSEGAVWEISNSPRRLAPIKAGDKVEFKRASLGFYFVRINGQLGVKGKRVQ